jgi:DNA-binding NarL/FixJ family response regulator
MVVDDHNLVRQGIRSLLEQAGDMQVMGEAANGLEAVDLVRRLQADVVVMDIVMPGLDGAQAAGQILHLRDHPQVVLLSMYLDPPLVQQALRAGVCGYLLKKSVVEELLLAVRAAARGENYISPAISSTRLSGPVPIPGKGTPQALAHLSEREVEVLKLIANGQTSAQIGCSLNISEKTVEKHRSRLMDKLDIHEIAGLVRFAIKSSLVSLDG